MENKKNDLVILLTGTITPNILSNLTIKDPEAREEQYKEALQFYIDKTNYKIIFAENSNNQFKNFPYLPDRIEYLTFNSQLTKIDRGKAFKEMEIIDFVFQNSKFLEKAESIVKITGRLMVLNINNLSKRYLKSLEKQSNLIYCYPYRPKNMDARCFFFTKDFWPFLKTRGKDITLTYNFEKSLWDAAYDYQKFNENYYKPINPSPRIKGLSGTFGIRYRHNLLFHYGRSIRNFVVNIYKK